MKRILLTLFLSILTFVAMSSDVLVLWDHGGTTNSVSGYQIHYGSSSRTYTNFVVTGYTTNTIISNVPPGVLLYYSGKTIGLDGTVTDFGNELEFTVVTPTNTLPSAVKDFRLTTVK